MFPTLEEFKPYVVTGLALGGVYALSGVGIVVLYRTTGVLNLAFGAIGAMGALISWTFPIIAVEAGGGNAFAFYAAMMFLQLLWALFVMPETKGVPLEEIQKELGIE